MFLWEVCLFPLGYKLRYAIVDRWGGLGATRVKIMTLSVSSRTMGTSVLGRRAKTWRSGRTTIPFRNEEKVLADAPHLPLWVKYTRYGKTYPAGEIIAVVN